MKLQSAFFKAAFFVAIFIVNCSFPTVDCAAQGQHYGSPLYSPRSYEDRRATESNGLPSQLQEVGIEQKLNEQLPLDTKFVDENNQEVELKKYFNGKPVVIALVYYECPMLCNEVLNGLTRTLKPLSLVAGKEFEVVAISFNAKETPELARAKKETYLANYGRENAEKGWHFLTGSQESIDKVTNAVGFKYRWDEATKQFAHAGGIQVATAEGKLARYFYGIDYAPKEVQFGLMEASKDRIGTPVDQLMLYCFHYDPSTAKYGLAVMRVMRLGGLVTILGLVGMLLILWKYKSGGKTSKIV